MLKLDDMEWDHFHTIKQKVLRELITELEGFEAPSSWTSEDTLRFIISKLKDKEGSC